MYILNPDGILLNYLYGLRMAIGGRKVASDFPKATLLVQSGASGKPETPLNCSSATPSVLAPFLCGLFPSSMLASTPSGPSLEPGL